MNQRTGVMPQSLRVTPQGFGGQQSQQPGRSASARLMNGGKLDRAGPNTPWNSFQAGAPMGNVGAIPSQGRQLGAGSFPQPPSAGSQPSTPLGLSHHDFPGLANTQPLAPPSHASLWEATSSRNLGGASLQRSQGTPISQAQQQQQQQQQREDMIGGSSRMPNSQQPFRFSNQAGLGHSSQLGQPSQPPSADDFPPLSRNANGNIGQERGSSFMSAMAFGATGQPGGSGPSLRGGVANGLLNALSASNRSAPSDARSQSAVAPPGTQRSQHHLESKSAEESLRHGAMATLHEDGTTASSAANPSHQAPQPTADGGSQITESRNPLGAIGKDAPNAKGREEAEAKRQDPLQGLSDADKFGIKGLRTLMSNYPDYQALVGGIDPQSLGLDWNSTEQISHQIYSIFDESAPRPPVPKYRLPECYNVTNVQPIDAKIQSFNEEILFWIFYSCPGDIKQHWAAQELNNRNWRWHKTQRVWLTKDDVMIPRVLSQGHEQGYYIIWDTENWRKERREMVLVYQDLDTSSARS